MLGLSLCGSEFRGLPFRSWVHTSSWICLCTSHHPSGSLSDRESIVRAGYMSVHFTLAFSKVFFLSSKRLKLDMEGRKSNFFSQNCLSTQACHGFIAKRPYKTPEVQPKSSEWISLADWNLRILKSITAHALDGRTLARWSSSRYIFFAHVLIWGWVKTYA